MVSNLLVLAIVPGHGAMGSFSFDSLAVRAHKN